MAWARIGIARLECMVSRFPFPAHPWGFDAGPGNGTRGGAGRESCSLLAALDARGHSRFPFPSQTIQFDPGPGNGKLWGGVAHADLPAQTAFRAAQVIDLEARGLDPMTMG